ncbi:MAG: tRNA (guanosine(37)-N1)-methyltransferase TrmD [Bacilli bacterium]|nr:tRNA (guanosine(37)-N1)-methyltransferase TrmD [Bacilli bacterium]
MKITILTLFPEIFHSFLNVSIINRALKKEKIKINLVNIRDFSTDKHKKVDDSPVSGGAGMIMQCQPIYDAIKTTCFDSYKILLSPRGKIFNQKEARKLSKKKNISIICGHYEGVDERINKYVDSILSAGDFILTGGEVAAMIIIDSIVRLINGVINKKSLINESFNDNLLEYPQYTKPYNFNGLKVPKILYCGNQKIIDKYHRKEQLRITKKYRPDLFSKVKLAPDDICLLKELKEHKNKISSWEKQAIKKAVKH